VALGRFFRRLGRGLDGLEIRRQQGLGLQRGDGLRDLWSVTTARRAGAAAARQQASENQHSAYSDFCPWPIFAVAFEA
jgi:hypothetical protein